LLHLLPQHPRSNNSTKNWLMCSVCFLELHPGYRPMHAKGIVCEGTFVPAAAAASLSRAPHFQRESVPVTVRFSDSTGLPDIPDGDPNASPRGLGIKFHLPGGAEADIIAHSVNAFPVGTAEEFLELLQAVAASGPGAPKPTPIEAFLGTHPRALKFVTAPKPAPASLASESYYAMNAFRFTNRDGVSRHARYQIHPADGEALSPTRKRPSGRRIISSMNSLSTCSAAPWSCGWLRNSPSRAVP